MLENLMNPFKKKESDNLKIPQHLSRAEQEQIKGIIENARRDGGFQLARPVEELTINDVYHALEGEGNEMKLSGLAHQIFDEDEKLAEDEKRVVEIFDKAVDAFENELKKISISDLLFKTDYTNGKTHWSDRILESKSQTA